MKKNIAVLFTLLISAFISAQTTIYTNDMDYVIGDAKQAFIQNKITTETQAKYLLEGMKNLGVNGIRIPIFADGHTPNKPMFDYFYKLAVAEGFPIFANPAQSSGGHRVACGMLNGELCPVKDDNNKTATLINRIESFASEYPCKWINPFNEDGRPGQAWSKEQINTIYGYLKTNVNGAELIGSCAWGIPASIQVMNETTMKDNITVAATHNLGYNHEDWDDFIAVAKAANLPVWDSEVNHNIGESNNRGTRIEVAIAAKVDGLVMYNIWNTINLSNGSINNTGRVMMDIYLKEMPSLTPNYKINNGDWIENSAALVAQGNTIQLAPLPSKGTWRWNGPNGFTATTREISITNFNSNNSGRYVASYTSPEGNVNHLTVTVALQNETPIVITPYYQIDGGSWKTNTTVQVSEGSKLVLGPNSSSTGGWTWKGPNDFSATNRQITVSGDIPESASGVYQLAHINTNGNGAIISYNIVVERSEVPFPDPNARYYIDSPERNVRLGADGSKAIATSRTTTGYQVEWTVKESTTAGYYYINCIGSVAKPRIRTQRNTTPQMIGSASTGGQTKWRLTESVNSTFYLDTALDKTAYPRLQINASQEPAMINSFTEDGSVRFTFTDTKKGFVGDDAHLAVDDFSKNALELLFPGIANNQGKVFQPLNMINGITEYELNIYNIHGQKVFTSNAIENGWSPSIDKKGIYSYSVNYQIFGGRTMRQNGMFYCNIK
ncbi:hypothetical protein [Flavicella sediminum]|uniref:hypothetical protein n=1 Tax=Flavicella sediminum TaxID=2585141 RepID=UPI00111D8958|nr:hypothetical protein [Flavicella sediminum]